jgi:glycosyltransferase involved in cell wall biosynthesis
MKVLHVIGSSDQSGAYKGVYILHKALINQNIKSKILGDYSYKKNLKKESDIVYINKNIFQKLLNKFFIITEKIFKFLFLKSPRSSFTFGLVGHDITKSKYYKDADILHIHWLGQGFIQLKSISKVNKPIIWTLRDMWPFTGGSHYSMDFQKYENGKLSKIIQAYKKKIYNNKIEFVAISDWLKKQAEKSNILNEYKIRRIYNNINIKEFNFIKKEDARLNLNIDTKKKIILFGAQNPQLNRKGWNILVETLKKLDKSKYFLLIFGNFWSQKTLDEIGVEYKSLGFIKDQKKLNLAYSSSDFFLFLSIQEAFGKTWAEAITCKIPVICFKDSCASEIIDHKKNGYIVDNINADNLKTGIEWLSNFQNNEIKLNENIDEKIGLFDSNIIAQKYIKLYEEVLKRNIKI